jgi:hypothetical protein
MQKLFPATADSFQRNDYRNGGSKHNGTGRCTSFYSVQIYFRNYSVGDFEKRPLQKLTNFLTNDYIVGSGSGLCAVLKGFDEFPEIDSTVREDVTDNYENWVLPIYKNN